MCYKSASDKRWVVGGEFWTAPEKIQLDKNQSNYLEIAARILNSSRKNPTEDGGAKKHENWQTKTNKPSSKQETGPDNNNMQMEAANNTLIWSCWSSSKVFSSKIQKYFRILEIHAILDSGNQICCFKI